MQAVLAMVALFASSQAEATALLASSKEAIASGALSPGSSETLAIIRAGDHFREDLRRASNNLEMVVELRFETRDPELRAWCLANVNSHDWGTRVAAARGLYRVATPQDAQILLQLLKDPATGRWTAIALGRLRCKAAIPDLISSLGAPSPVSGGAGANDPATWGAKLGDASRLALEMYGPEIVPQILPLISADQDAVTVTRACLLLRRLGSREAGERAFGVFQQRVGLFKLPVESSLDDFFELQQLASLVIESRHPEAKEVRQTMEGRRQPTSDNFLPTVDEMVEVLARGGYVARYPLALALERDPIRVGAILRDHLALQLPSNLPELLNVVIDSELDALTKSMILESVADYPDSKVRYFAAYGFRSTFRTESLSALLSLTRDLDSLVAKTARQAIAIQIGIPLALGKSPS